MKLHKYINRTINIIIGLYSEREVRQIIIVNSTINKEFLTICYTKAIRNDNNDAEIFAAQK